jgi:alkyl sulfatase BDS1-like metallo-beta-lactamase superfamily hydrolase
LARLVSGRAAELRNGVKSCRRRRPQAPDLITNMSLDMVFEYMAIQLDANRRRGGQSS